MHRSIHGHKSIPLLTIIVAVLFTAGGCESESLNPVRGKVIVNGVPAVGATVMLFPEGKVDVGYVPATGTAGEDGTFTLMTGAKSGAKAGKYVVTVVWPDPKKKLTDAEKMQGLGEIPDLLAGRFATPEKSSLRAEIKSGENNLETFDIK